jgi:hypothetical protein
LFQVDGFSSPVGVHPTPLAAEPESKPKSAELEEARSLSLLVPEREIIDCGPDFELEAARLPTPLETAGRAVIAEKLELLEVARLLAPLVVGPAVTAC